MDEILKGIMNKILAAQGQTFNLQGLQKRRLQAFANAFLRKMAKFSERLLCFMQVRDNSGKAGKATVALKFFFNSACGAGRRGTGRFFN